MTKFFKNIVKNFSTKGGIFMFLRAQLSSQMASVADNSLAFILKKVLDIFKVKSISFFSHGIESYVFATIIGQICGGFVSCFMNYQWTFKSKNVKFRYILFKFLFVWLGSLFLNTYFTFLLTEWLKERKIVEHIFGYHSDDVFIFVKLFVALIVGFFWNYAMYRRFVYKDVSFNKWFGRIFHKQQ
ncbi:MAG: GtrA family protein [Prevotellaceae bacterium]|jgi:putative flippase GtrA|nr:GtrA family protein [Prevotellaceae bacterium]